MKIYFEVILILNFLLDFMILYGTKRILKIKKSIIRTILGSILGTITTIFLFIKINSLTLFFIKLIISSLMILVSFGYKNYFQTILYFYLLSIIIGGFIYLFDLKQTSYFYYLSILILSIIIINIIIYELLQYKEKYHNKYLVTIYYQNKKYNLEGFIDTGNRLISPIKREAVILVNLNINSKRVLYIPYKALNTSGIIPCIRPDKVIINKKEFTNCLIGLSKDKFELNGLDCILPNKFKEELC